MTTRGRGVVVIALKIAATAALFWFVLSRVDIGELASRLSAARMVLALLAGACVLALQSLMAALRLRTCAGLLSQPVNLSNAWIACQFGGLFSHTPMSFVGGDAMRVWHLVRSAVALPDAAKAVLLDRALGFVGMMVLVLLTSPALYAVIKAPAMWTGYLLILALGLGAASAFIALGRIRLGGRSGRFLAAIAEFATISRYLSFSAPTGMALALAVVINALNGLAIWAIGAAYGLEIGFATAMIASPVVFLVAMIPVSVAGWGLREGGFVVAFGLFGVSSADALTVSVTFGIAVLLAYSPAAVLLLRARRRSGHAATEAGYGQASSQPTARS